MHKTSSTPRLVLLDLGGVVFNSTGTTSEFIDWTVITELNHRYGPGLNIGENLFPQFMHDYNRRTGQQLSGDDFLAAVFDTLIFNAPLVDYLRQRWPIYILSDNYRENIAYSSQRYAFAEWSVGQYYSFDFGLTKEDPALFHRLLTDLNVAPTDCLLIDDSPHKIEAARVCSIPAIRFENNAQLRQVIASKF